MNKNIILIKKITYSAIFIALTMVLKKYSFGTESIRFSVFEIPIVVSGILLGPVFGAIVGLFGDLLYSLVSGYSFLLLFTISSTLTGLISGIILHKKVNIKRIIITIIIVLYSATLINSVQLYIIQKEGMYIGLPLRIITATIKIFIESIIINIMYNKLINKVVIS